ncbi:2,5-diamino-6-(5-phosphoribosylamino)pyrimidin-4(3H)-one reductase [Methanolobus vulcani]|jgi:2,5-diamino-6-(ribosylamino)-4(3H)-pyrimidinone 5'-phosphate reductase|uniref:2,5-diamino-6-(ribosylamino)-4(3H)-pyrimidinone 5'-phosphate reductase n=1 Tax=Methanolobus vulcani TaxID=38026 RepID=A0A7Z7FC15_9EURY|nr:2,5-diamino-6-(ribosylamino)-4(3H)-pyrimidinone 5'-phosphate reductase [Methanolobus vulcani]SDF49431.1 2,5-diamino-6-(5-phosphoribosylamino)pyrimidin-4(3H)-one reductase [Methanolobus vulcani]
MERPFVFINSAMSADGKISTKERKQVRISGQIDFNRMDKLRAGSDAVMVGIGTVLADDPSLTVKSAELKEERISSGRDENPARIIVDSKARTPLDADIFKKGKGKRIIIVSESAPADKVDLLKEQAIIVVAGEENVDLKKAMSELKNQGIERLMIEGGATLNWGMISNGLVDEFYTFVGNLIIGGKTAPTFTDGEGFTEKDIQKLELIDAEKMEEGVLLKWKVLANSEK